MVDSNDKSHLLLSAFLYWIINNHINANLMTFHSFISLIDFFMSVGALNWGEKFIKSTEFSALFPSHHKNYVHDED